MMFIGIDPHMQTHTAALVGPPAKRQPRRSDLTSSEPQSRTRLWFSVIGISLID